MSIKLGFTLTVLKITIEETQDLLEAVVNNFNGKILERQLNPESILAACDREGITKDELFHISIKLPQSLIPDYAVDHNPA